MIAGFINRIDGCVNVWKLQAMDRRKDTANKGTKLPRDYLKLVEDVFNKNFGKFLLGEKSSKERFIVYGELYPDELVLSISLQHPGKSLGMTTCYCSVDYPPPQLRKESGAPAASASEAVQLAVNQSVDATASFFNTFFEEGRPVDYDMEYRQNWTAIDLDKNIRVYIRINRDNPDLEAQADAILAAAEDKKKKKNLH